MNFFCFIHRGHSVRGMVYGIFGLDGLVPALGLVLGRGHSEGALTLVSYVLGWPTAS